MPETVEKPDARSVEELIEGLKNQVASKARKAKDGELDTVSLDDV